MMKLRKILAMRHWSIDATTWLVLCGQVAAILGLGSLAGVHVLSDRKECVVEWIESDECARFVASEPAQRILATPEMQSFLGSQRFQELQQIARRCP